MADLRGEQRDAFLSGFIGMSYRSAAVVDASLETRVGDDGAFPLLALSLGPPPRGADTWPQEDLFELRQLVRRKLSADGADDDVVVSWVGGVVTAPSAADTEPATDKSAAGPGAS